MVVPVRDEAAEQIRPAQKRTVARSGAAEDEVVAAAGADVPAIDHEFLRRQPRLACILVERRGLFGQLLPGGRRLDVDFDHAGVRRDVEVTQPWIGWRW